MNDAITTIIKTKSVIQLESDKMSNMCALQECLFFLLRLFKS